MKKLLGTLALIAGLSISSIASAADVDRFKVEVNPTRANVGDTIDLTITALDKDGNIAIDYLGNVLIFSESDADREFPGILSDNTYQFTEQDQGEVKFENGVKFSRAGLHDISVYDTENDVDGGTEVEVFDGDVVINGEIEMISPENGATIAESEITVSGKATENHRVTVLVNGQDEYETISDSDGIFEVDMEVEDGVNTLQAFIYDADDNVIGQSDDTVFEVDASKPIFKSIEFDPSQEEYTPGQDVVVRVYATKGLESVDLIFNDMLESLEEEEDGVYVGFINAPEEEDLYTIDVDLRNIMGAQTYKSEVTALIVAEPIEDIVEDSEDGELPAAEVCEITEEEIAVNSVSSRVNGSSSVLSWDAVNDAASYNVYKEDTNGNLVLVDNVTSNSYSVAITGDEVVHENFAVKAVVKTELCDLESDYSDMVAVQTGPKETMLLILAIILGIGSVAIVRRKNA